jgi:hypothetical protein
VFEEKSAALFKELLHPIEEVNPLKVGPFKSKYDS